MTRSAAPCNFYHPASYCAEESVGYLMKRIVVSIVVHADKRLTEVGLTSAQWRPMLRLKDAGASTAAELARWLQVDAGAMTRLLDRLEKKGLLKRVRSTEDRRVVLLELTPTGEAAIVDVPVVLTEVLNAHLTGFSKTECQALTSYLQRMVANGEALRDALEAAGAPSNDRSAAPESTAKMIA